MQMLRPVPVWLALISIHLAVCVGGQLIGGDSLAKIVVSTVHSPLSPFDKLGLPVFQQTGWFLPPPTLLGWATVVLFWLACYWCFATMVTWLFKRISRSA